MSGSLPKIPAAIRRVLETISRADTVELQWPIAIFRFPGKLEEDTADELLQLMDAFFAQKQPFGLITDMRRMQVPNARVRRVLGEYQKTRQPDFTRWIAGDAHIISNSLLRGLVTAINWIGPAEHPQGFFGSEQEALAWTREQLLARGEF